MGNVWRTGAAALAGALILNLAPAAADEPLRVGVYQALGGAGMREALRAEPGMACDEIERLDAGTLFQYDVVALPALRGMTDRGWEDALEAYARCGGGLLLQHNAAGYRGWNRALFPDVFTDGGSSRQRAMTVTAEPGDPAAAGLPSRFQQDYQDHVILAPGPSGRVLVRDADGAAAVVAGEVEQGRIIGSGLLPGVFVERAEHVERAPGAAERALLVQSVRWLGAGRWTQLDEAERAARRRRVELAIELRNAALVAESHNPLATTIVGRGGADWFTDSMYNDQGFVHPPIEILPGRFFMFDGMVTAIAARNEQLRPYGETLAILQQLKWLGVTDIITHTGGPQCNLRYLSRMTNAVYGSRAKRYGGDYLEIIVKAAHETGMNVWGFWHSKQQGGSFPIADALGRPYAEFGDIKNPAYLQQARICLDELAERYNPYGNFKGVFLDELWHAFSADYMEGQTNAFAGFCREQFGEAPPAALDLSAMFAQGPDWCDPADVWWRRYVLFRNHFTVKYIREVTAYANSRGLQTMPQVGFGFRWFSGHGDTAGLLAAGNLPWTYENRNNSRYEQYPSDGIILASHSRTHSGIQQICHLRGKYGSQFALEQTWSVFSGQNPRVMEVFARQVRANREWYGAASLSSYALVVNHAGMDLSLSNAVAEYKIAANGVQAWLQQRYPVGQLMIQDHRYFGRYAALIGARHGLRCMSGEAFAALRRYLEGGGALLVLDDQISTARADLTAVADQFETLTGVGRAPADSVGAPCAGAIVWAAPLSNAPALSGSGLVVRAVGALGADTAVLARRDDGAPLVTLRRFGRGQVAAFHGDMTQWLAQPETRAAALDCAAAVLDNLAPSPIRLEGNAQIYNAVRKGNWVAVSLVGLDTDYATFSTNFPARGRLRVDLKALGLDFPQYKVLSLARDREVMPAGKHWDEFSRNYWTAGILAGNGVEVYIPRDSLADLELRCSIESERLRKYVLPMWNKSKQARSYEHEILAIAPVEEAAMVPVTR